MDKRDKDDLKQFNKELSEFKEKIARKKGPLPDKLNRLSAFKVLADIISGIAVGGFLGYILDVYLGTLPFMLFILTVFGMVGGVYNIYKDLETKKDE